MPASASAETPKYRSNMVAGLLVPLHGMDLVLPNEAVAEIVDYCDPEPAPDSPPWFLGVLHWRGLVVPVISYEILNAKQVPANQPAERIVVLNGVGGRPELPFLAIRAQGIPRLLRIHSDEIAPAEGKKGPADAQMAQIKEGVASIPNINLLEQMIIRARKG